MCIFMNRRRFLSAVGVGTTGLVSGCGGGYLPINRNTPVGGFTAKNRTSLPDDFDGIAHVKLVSVDAVKAKYNLRLSAEVVKNTVTRDQTAQLKVTAQNLSSSHDAYTGPVLFTWIPSDPAEPTISLHRAFRSRPDYKVGPNCWKPNERVRYSDDIGLGKLGPQETQTDKVDLWGHRSNPDGVCIPSGTFSVSKRFEAANPSNTDFSWGFSIDITKP